jgi:hypothetical protein
MGDRMTECELQELESNSVPDSELVKLLIEEHRRLRQENSRLKWERTILTAKVQDLAADYGVRQAR